MKQITTITTITTFLALLLSSCTTSTQPQKSVKVIDIASNLGNDGDIKLSDIAGQVSYIFLETRSDCLLSEDVSLSVAEGKFILLNQGKVFMVFSEDGKYIQNIGNAGKGPHEYLSAREYSINRKKREICVASIFTDKMVVYSLDGQFLREFPIPPNLSFVIQEPTGGYHLATYRPNIKDSVGYRFSRMDDQGKITQIFSEKEIKLPASGIILKEFRYYTYNNQVYLQNGFADTIFCFNKDRWIPDLYFDLGKYTPPQEFWDNLSFYGKNQGKFISQVGFVVQDKEIILCFNLKKKLYMGLYNLANKTLLFAQETDSLAHGFINDIDGGPGVQPLWSEDDGDYWYFLLQAIDLKDWKAKGYFDRQDVKYPDQNTRLKAMIDQLSDSSNPVIMKVKKKR